MFKWLKAWRTPDPPLIKDYQKDLINVFSIDIVKLIRYINEIPTIDWSPKLAVDIPIKAKYLDANQLLSNISSAISATYTGDISGIKSFGSYEYKYITAYEYFTDYTGKDFHPNRLLEHLAKELLVLSDNCDRTPGLNRNAVIQFLFPLLEECVMIAALMETLPHESRSQRP